MSEAVAMTLACVALAVSIANLAFQWWRTR